MTDSSFQYTRYTFRVRLLGVLVASKNTLFSDLTVERVEQFEHKLVQDFFCEQLFRNVYGAKT